jgi:hypothetical protein
LASRPGISMRTTSTSATPPPRSCRWRWWWRPGSPSTVAGRSLASWGRAVGDSEDEVFWRTFLTELKKRGLSGVRLVISDQHAGLVAALRRSFHGAVHQRCRVHFARKRLIVIGGSAGTAQVLRSRRLPTSSEAGGRAARGDSQRHLVRRRAAVDAGRQVTAVRWAARPIQGGRSSPCVGVS